MGFEDRLGRGQTGAHRLGAAAETGEEVGLDKSRDDAHVGVDITPVEAHRRGVHTPHFDVLAVVGAVVVDRGSGEGSPVR